MMGARDIGWSGSQFEVSRRKRGVASLRKKIIRQRQRVDRRGIVGDAQVWTNDGAGLGISNKGATGSTRVGAPTVAFSSVDHGHRRNFFRVQFSCLYECTRGGEHAKGIERNVEKSQH